MDFVDKAKGAMGKLEGLMAQLPGLKGYKEKELRREADKTVRDMLVRELGDQRQRLATIQMELVNSGGLRWVDDVDRGVTKLQLLSDRIKTASYGYAPLFDDVRVKEAQLDALIQFDQQMTEQVVELKDAVDTLAGAVMRKEGIGEAIPPLNNLLDELNTTWGHRDEVILNTGNYTPAGDEPR
jgi:hypothetical protein